MRGAGVSRGIRWAVPVQSGFDKVGALNALL